MRRRAELAFFSGNLLVTAVATVVALRLWDATAEIPFAYFFDSLVHGAIIKSTIEHGWYLDNPALGAPHGLELHDFPLGGENLHVALMKVLSLFSSDWAVVMNAYFVIGFLLVSAAAYVVLRQIGLARWTSLCAANLFSLLPYHFVAGELQLFQATYFAVPLGAFLVLDVLGWDLWRRPFLARGEEGRPRATVFRWAVRAALCAIVASAGSYYGAFTVVLVVVAALVVALVDGDRRVVLRAAPVVLLLVATVAANNAPTLLYRHAHGTNSDVAARRLGESDFWALHIVDLFLPAQGHRLQPFADVKAKLDRFWPVSPVAPAPHVPLGLAGAAGLSASILGVARAVRRRSPPGRTGARLATLGLVNLAGILIASATGFSALLALLGFTQLRAWSRMSVFIGFFSLAALGLVAPALEPRLLALARRRGISRRAIGVAGAPVVAVALTLLVLDQTPASYAPAATREVYANDREFVRRVERILPSGAAVLQLPLATFPEGLPIASMADYTHLRAYLHSEHLRWSYPAMRGRPADWAWSLGGRPLPAVLDAATAAGFSGLWVDRSGFVDQARALERGMTSLVGEPAASSPHGLAFWDLRRHADAQLDALGAEGLRTLRRLVLDPVVPAWTSGFDPPIGDPPSVVRGDFLPYPELPGQSFTTERPASSPAVVELHNPLPERRPVRVEVTVRTDAPEGDRLSFATAGRPDVTVPVSTEAEPMELSLVLDPGTNTIRITSAVDARFWTRNLLVLDGAG